MQSSGSVVYTIHIEDSGKCHTGTAISSLPQLTNYNLLLINN